jgi:ABC-type lipoprotein release transport system permease subunit
MILRLAWRNIWRNKNRSLITISSVLFAVMLAIVMSSIQMGAFENLIRNVVSFYTGYVQVHKAGYWEEQLIDNGFTDTPGLRDKLTGVPGINGIVPRLETFMLASSETFTHGVLVVGAEPESEDKLTGLSSKIKEGGYFNTGDKSVLLGEGLARKLELRVNDTLVLIGQGYHGVTAAGKYPVKGLISFGSPELNDRTVFMPITAAREMLGAENIVTAYVLNLDDPSALGEIVEAFRLRLGDNYEVMSWQEMLPEIQQHIESDRIGFYIMIGILYVIIAFGIFGTVIMMTKERQYEFGVLTSIGMKRRLLGIVVVLETSFISIIGVAAGMLLSIPVVYYFSKYPIRLSGEMAEAYRIYGFEAILPTSTDISHFYTQAAIVLCISLIISLYPFIKVLNINPLEAMRK